MPLSDDKLIKMCEDVAVTREKVETLGRDVSVLKTDVSSLKLSWENEDTSRTEIRTSVGDMKGRLKVVEDHCNGGLLAQLTPKDWKMVVKWGAAIITFLVVGSAGGQGLKELIQALLAMLTAVP